MPGVYFVTTTEPITGQKTQVTAVFPSKNQSVAVKADNDKKMAEMSVPQKDETVHFVDQPFSLITPNKSSHPPPPPHVHNPYYNPYLHQFHHSHPAPFPYFPFHQTLPPMLPGFPQPSFLMQPSFVSTSMQTGPAMHQMAFVPQQPWSTPILPPIGNPIMQQPSSAPPNFDLTRIASEDEDDDGVHTHRSRSSRHSKSKRKYRDILLVDDAVIRSMGSRDQTSRRRFSRHNSSLRVIQQSPIQEPGNNILS